MTFRGSAFPAIQPLDMPSVHELSGRLMDAFASRGYERLALPIVQPADVFLDVLGEKAAANAFTFSDPDGDAYCLRTDLTVPACRAYLERGGARREAKVCAGGLVFRARDEDGGRPPSQEFRQAGLEWFGDADAEEADAETAGVVVAALRAAGLRSFAVKIGDVGLFRAIVAGLDLPDRWRWRVLDAFAKEAPLAPLLARLGRDGGGGPDREDILRRIDPGDFDGACALVEEKLKDDGTPLIGSRPVEEIARRLIEQAADRRETPVSPHAIALVEGYMDIDVPADAAAKRIASLTPGLGAAAVRAVDAFSRRLTLLRKAGVDLTNARFSAAYGRGFEYYTGFVFDISAEGDRPANRVAGGGRYDGLLRAAGAGADVTAVGAAVYVERLYDAIRRLTP